MTLAHFTTRTPQLLSVLETLAGHPNHGAAALTILHELAGITVLVARKFTNDRTAEGLLEAYYLTIGCISLGISRADIPHDSESELSFLLHYGAEVLFQTGFRHIKELANLPSHTMVSNFDQDPYIKQRNIKALFSELCHADPAAIWCGDDNYQKELLIRRDNQHTVECATWLRKHHFSGAIKDPDMDANAVIAIAVIFAILDDQRVVARTGQKEIENLIIRARATPLDVDTGWAALINKVPTKFQTILSTQMDAYRNTIVKKILSKTKIKTIVTEIQNYYAGNEQEVDYD
jgi:hypothetical protein